MLYFITFLEGFITFVSPCMLPMLPVYLSYFAGAQGGRRRVLRGALGFVLGFTLVFVALGALAGVVGGFLVRYRTAVNLVTGLVVVLFGLGYLGVFRLGLFRGANGGRAAQNASTGFWSSVLFGLVFSVGWTPCVGAFLGSALMLASQQGSAAVGILLLLLYSLGLGIPFVASALLVDRLGQSFAFIKKHYAVITRVSGLLLVAVGIAMMTGYLGRLLSALSFL